MAKAEGRKSEKYGKKRMTDPLGLRIEAEALGNGTRHNSQKAQRADPSFVSSLRKAACHSHYRKSGCRQATEQTCSRPQRRSAASIPLYIGKDFWVCRVLKRLLDQFQSNIATSQASLTRLDVDSNTRKSRPSLVESNWRTKRCGNSSVS